MKTLSLSKKCLFGGTILAAGLVNQAANAKSTFTLNYSYAIAQAWDGTAAYFLGAGPFNVAVTDATYGFASANAYGNANAIGAFATTYVPTYWGQALEWYSYFTVTQNGTITASWDFTGDTYGSPGFYASALTVDDITNNVTLFQTLWDGGNNGSQMIGSVQIPVAAGVQYYVQPFALGWSGTSWAHITIPNPATATLLGVAGILATRRRR